MGVHAGLINCDFILLDLKSFPAKVYQAKWYISPLEVADKASVPVAKEPFKFTAPSKLTLHTI